MNYTLQDYSEALNSGRVESIYELPEVQPTDENYVNYLNSRRYLTFKEWRAKMHADRKLNKE